jgi:small subunit ribosomal protein S27Ae
MAEKTKGKKEQPPGKVAPKPAEKPAGKPGEKPVEKAEEKPVEKPKEKGKKPPKVRKKEKGAYTRYKVDASGLTRLRPYCERCGPGFFMADHGDRFACGHCGFTRYKRA